MESLTSSSSPVVTPPPSPPPEMPFRRATIDITNEQSKLNTVVELAEFNARENPTHIFCVQGGKGGLQTTVSHDQLKQAVQICRKHLLETISELQLPAKGEDGIIVKGRPVALLGESDVGLVFHMLALVSLGIPVLLLSARLSPVAVHHLVGKTGACALLVSARLKATAEAALELIPDGPQRDTRPSIHVSASFSKFLEEPQPTTSTSSICDAAHYIDENDRDVLILHSSGTTGLPKPIYTSHRHLLSFTTCHSLNNPKEAGRLCLSTLPLYHGFGLIAPFLSMGVGMPFCLLPPSVIPTGYSVSQWIRSSGARSLISVPSILEELSLESEGIDLLAGLQFAAFGGGQLKPLVGEKLSSAGVRLLNHYGTTESGPLAPIFVPNDEYDYRYFRLRSDLKMKIDTAPAHDDGEQRFTLTTFPFGWGGPFTIQDQLVQDPRNPGSDFNAIGRTDDVIVLATGEKVLPNILESKLSEDERVFSAIAFGQGQFEIGIIVQPSPSLKIHDVDAYKASLWPVVQQANERMDAHGRISSLDTVIVLAASESLPRSDKGSIMRREVYQKFQEQINKVYKDMEERISDTTIPTLRMDNLESAIQEFIQTSLNWKLSAGEWSHDDDLFEIGMDSLQAVQLRRFLTASVPGNQISRDFVYVNSSIFKMSQALRGSLEATSFAPTDSEEIDKLAEEYAIRFQTSHAASNDGGAVFVLTGATGSLGGHLLAHLVELPEVARIICLNRPVVDTHAFLRQHDSLAEKGIKLPQSAWSKIDVISTNTSLPQLGLSEAWYSSMRSSATHIVHAAWPMDFKRKVHSFKSTFQTLQNLLTLAQEAHTVHPLVRPRLLFISSIATVGQHPKVKGGCIVPEEPVTEYACANSIGYAQAKLVCEKMIEKAALKVPESIEVSYIRVGQMAGSSNTGYWNTQEHLPALIAGSKLIGKLPKLRGTLSWIPVDDAASSVAEIALSPGSLRIAYHVENPVRQPWHDVLSSLAPTLSIDIADSVPLTEWLMAMRNSAKSSDQTMKLVEFFEEDFEHMACGNIIMDTYHSRQASSTMGKMQSVSLETAASYVSYWRSIGFLA